MKILVRILLGLAILALAFVIVNMRMGFRTSDAGTERYFTKRNARASIRKIPVKYSEIRAVETRGEDLAPDAPLIIFIHGAPGSANNFFKYQADSLLRSRAMMVSIDRLGYGYSHYGRSEVSIAKQAETVKDVIDYYGGRKAILVGHSYGGPIAAKVAMDYPERVQSVLMLAPVNDPDNEKIFWFAHFGHWKATKWMLSPAWQVSGDEKFSHAEELQKIAAGWKEIRVPVVHMHGDKDSLAPPVNMEFSKKNIAPDMLRMERMPKAGHLIPFLNFDTVRGEILKLLDKA